MAHGKVWPAKFNAQSLIINKPFPRLRMSNISCAHLAYHVFTPHQDEKKVQNIGS